MWSLSARSEETPNLTSSGKRTACLSRLDTGRFSIRSGLNQQGYPQVIICQIKCPKKFSERTEPWGTSQVVLKRFCGKQISAQFNQHDRAIKMKLESLYAIKESKTLKLHVTVVLWVLSSDTELPTREILENANWKSR